jgi:hypothetical protein
MVTDGCWPTVSLHASNDPAFLDDVSATVIVDPSRKSHVHTLKHSAGELWCIVYTGNGSEWTLFDVETGQADVFVSRFWDAPWHTQTYSDGRVVHNPPPPPLESSYIPITPGTWRYYALVVSVGVTDPSRPYVVELQELRVMLEATPAPEPPMFSLYERAALSNGAAVYALRLSRPRRGRVPTVAPPTPSASASHRPHRGGHRLPGGVEPVPHMDAVRPGNAMDPVNLGRRWWHPDRHRHPVGASSPA